jgi:hypothetical protein
MNINIQSSTWDKIIAYAQSAYDEFKAEIGGMAIAYRPSKDSDEFIIEEPAIMKQIVSSGNCVLDKEALAQYYVDTAKKHKDKIDLSFVWWHSHHTMEAFWSGTDLTAIQEMAGGNYSFSLVVNLKEEYKFRVNIWEPVQIHQDIELNIIKETPNVTNEVKALCEGPNYNVGWGGKKNAYTYNSYNQQQYLSMWGQQPPNKLVQAVEDVLKKLAFGEETPKVTKKALEKLNKQAQESTEYSVGVPTVKQLKENIMFIETDNLIHESKDIWDFETAIEENLEDFKEMNMHNQSYVL